MAHDGDNNPVSGEVTCLIVVRRQGVAVWKAHKASRFAWGDEARAKALAVNDKNELSAGPADRGSETAGNIIETDFSTLYLSPIGVAPGPFVDGSDGALAAAFRFFDLRKVNVAHHFHELSGLCFGVPSNACWIIFNQVGERDGACGGLR